MRQSVDISNLTWILQASDDPYRHIESQFLCADFQCYDWIHRFLCGFIGCQRLIENLGHGEGNVKTVQRLREVCHEDGKFVCAETQHVMVDE